MNWMGDIILSKTIGAISTKDYILWLLIKAGLSNIIKKKEKKNKYKFSFSFFPCVCKSKGVGLFNSDNTGIFLTDLFVSISLGALFVIIFWLTVSVVLIQAQRTMLYTLRECCGFSGFWKILIYAYSINKAQVSAMIQLDHTSLH